MAVAGHWSGPPADARGKLDELEAQASAGELDPTSLSVTITWQPSATGEPAEQPDPSNDG